MDIPSCNNVDIDWYLMSPRDPHPVEPNVETQPQLQEAESTILEPTFPLISQLSH